MSFKDYVLLQEEEQKRTFCYMIYPTSPYTEQLLALQQSLHIQAEEILPAPEFHCTIRYVKLNGSQDSDLFTKWIENQQLPVLEAYTQTFSMFKDGSLVIELDSPEIQEWFDRINGWMTDSGGYAPSDFPTFKPHISLAHGTTSPLPVFDVRSHRLNVKFSLHKVTNTNREVIFSRGAQSYKGLEYGTSQKML